MKEQFTFPYEGKQITTQVVKVEKEQREIKLPVDTLLRVW